MKLKLSLFLCLILSASLVSAQDSCTLCKFVVQTVEGYLANNATQTQIISYLQQACDFVPAPFDGECRNLVSTKGHDLIDYVIKNGSPEVLCTSMKLCASRVPLSDAQISQFKQISKEQLAMFKVSDQSTCGLCQFVVQTVESYIVSNQSEAQIVGFLLRACDFAPQPFDAECRSIVNAKGPQLIEWIVNKYNAETVCKFMKLCADSAVTRNVAAKARVGDESACELCKFVVQTVESYITSNTSKAKIIETLEKACALLPAPYSTQCTIIVDAQAPQIIDWLIAKQSPEKICQLVKACPATITFVDNALVSPKLGKCDLCQYVIQTVEYYATSKVSEDKIIAFISQACDLIPTPFNHQCRAAVAAKGVDLIDWIVSKAQPDVVCGYLKLCPSAHAILLPMNSAALAPALGDDSTCALCQFVIQTVETYIQSNASKAKIIETLDKACALLPQPYAAQCAMIVDTQGPQIIDWLIAKQSPEKICQLLGICAAHRLPAKALRIPKDTTCSLCQFVIQTVEGYITSNATEAQIVAFLQKACSLVPYYGDECRSVVANNAPALIEYIVKAEQPEVVCQFMRLCPKTFGRPEAAQVNSKSLQSGATCSLCQVVVQTLESYVLNEETEAKIIAYVQNACTFVPAPFVDQCKAAVAAQGAQIIEWVVEQGQPEKVCKLLKLCSTSGAKALAKLPSDSTCTLCEFVIETAENYITNGATEDSILAFIKTACQYVPAPYDEQCRAIVDAKGKGIIEWLVQKESPEKVCTMLHLCS